MNAVGLSFSGQSFNFSYFLQYVQSLSSLSLAFTVVAKKITIDKIIKIEIKISVNFLYFGPG